MPKSMLISHLIFATYVFLRCIYPFSYNIKTKILSFITIFTLSQAVSVAFYCRFLSVGDTLIYSRILSFFMTAFLVFVFLLLFRDLSLFILFLLRKIFKSEKNKISQVLSSRKSIYGLFASMLIITLLGMYGGLKVPAVQEVSITIPNLPPQLKDFKIVQFTDTHIGSGLDDKWLKNVVEIINSLEPDIIVGTGDMIDGSVEQLKDYLSFHELKAKYGVFLGVGNHEYYFNVVDWYNYFKDLGMPIFVNENVVLDIDGAKLAIMGNADLTANRMRPHYDDPEFARIAARPSNELSLKNVPEDSVKILLDHQPNSARVNATYAYDLQLAGHTHGGLTPLLFPIISAANDGFISGLYQVDDMQLYVSRGTGLWGFVPFRLGVPSEITLITLK